MSVISEEELQEIVEVVWMTVLELAVVPGDETELALSDYVTCEIEITGAWEGVVTVRASEQFLAHAASVMFNCSMDDVSEMDRSDTLTELTNMLGGTVKCLLPETSDLSLPIILLDASTDQTAHEWCAFSCEGKPLAVAVTEISAESRRAA